MKTDRPKLKIPFKGIDIAIELASIALLILMWLHLILEYNDLPDTVASHFNGVGNADGYSDKSYLWLLPLIATALYIGLFILNRFPHLHNYMVNITEANALKQYTFSTRLLRTINFLCALMFAYINYAIIIGAKTQSLALGKGFLYVVIACSLLLPIIVFVFQKKLNQ